MIIESKRPSAPIRAQQEITYGCNHRCPWCYALSSDVSLRPSAPADTGKPLAVARALAESGIFYVTITGGEPLTRKDLTREVIRIYKDAGVKVSLNSNLTLLDEDMAQFLSNERVSVLTSCPASEPGDYNSLTGTVNHALFEKGVRLLVSKGVHVTVNMVVTQLNKGDVISTARRVSALGVRSFGATPMSLSMDYPRPDLSLTLEDVRQVIRDLLWVKENIGMEVDIIEALPKCAFPPEVLRGDYAFLRRKCQAGETTVSVSPDGEVRPCGHNTNSYGNILKDGLPAVWAAMGEWAEGKYIPEQCRTCSWLERCKGGCRINAMTARGSWDSMDIWAPGPIAEPPSAVSEESVTLGGNTLISVSRSFAFRDEGDGTRLCLNRKDGGFFMVNDSLGAFMEDLQKREDDTLYPDLVKAYGAEGDGAFGEVVTFLVRKGFLKVKAA